MKFTFDMKFDFGEIIGVIGNAEWRQLIKIC